METAKQVLGCFRETDYHITQRFCGCVVNKITIIKLTVCSGLCTAFRFLKNNLRGVFLCHCR